MNPSGPQLIDIHAPSAPSWWPPAPGWWLVAVMVLVLVALLLRSLRRRARYNATRRVFASELDSLCARHPANQQNAARVAGLAVLLRRIACHHQPAARALQGEAWLRYLDGKLADRPFSSGIGRLLLDAPYRPQVSTQDADALFTLVRSQLARWARPAHA